MSEKGQRVGILMERGVFGDRKREIGVSKKEEVRKRGRGVYKKEEVRKHISKANGMELRLTWQQKVSVKPCLLGFL